VLQDNAKRSADALRCETRRLFEGRGIDLERGAMRPLSAGRLCWQDEPMNAPLQHLYRVVPTRLAMVTAGPTPEEIDAIDAHFTYLEGLLADGKLILAGRTANADESIFGLVILDVSDPEEALRLMQADPAVARGVMRAELFPYRVALSR
jgi:uncharacterized protein